MERQVLLDALSEAMVAGFEAAGLYRAVAGRAVDQTMQQRYTELAADMDAERLSIARIVEGLSADPGYVSPMARMAQVKIAGLRESSLRSGGLSPAELQLSDAENVFLCATRVHALWRALEHTAGPENGSGGPQDTKAFIHDAEERADRALAWASDALANLRRATLEGPAPDPHRLEGAITTPRLPIAEIHPAPVDSEDGLLMTAVLPMWTEPAAARVAEQG